MMNSDEFGNPALDFPSYLPPQSANPSYSSMNQPNLPYQPYRNPSYANGGLIKNMASKLQSYGEDEDTILAHINPEEAQELAIRHGGDVNPLTGLPQFGLFKGINKLIKKAGPWLGATAGLLLGGPAGAIVGGGIGGGLKGDPKRKSLGHGNPLKTIPRGALKGALLDLGTQALMGGLGGVGSGSAAAGLGAAGAGSATGAAATGAAGGASSGLLGGLGASLGGLSLNDLLLGGAIAGTLLGKQKPPQMAQQVPQQFSDNAPLPMPNFEGNSGQYTKFTPRERALNQFHPNVFGAGTMPENVFYEDYNPLRGYAHGGLISGSTGGQDDEVPGYVSDGKNRSPIEVSDGEFVWPADVVSALGDGNTAAGARKLADGMKKIRMDAHSGQKGGLPRKTKSVISYLGGK